jgi:predicted phosphoribosyltransferase
MNRSLARRAPRPVAASTVILVDDVITTGASMAAAAGALRSIGVQSVIGLAIAWNASEAEVAAGRVLGADARASTQRGVARRL